jgi:hypothetical protein
LVLSEHTGLSQVEERFGGVQPDEAQAAGHENHVNTSFR